MIEKYHAADLADTIPLLYTENNLFSEYSSYNFSTEILLKMSLYISSYLIPTFNTTHDYSTHRQTPWTDNDPSLLFAALGKAKPLISTATRQKFDLDH